MKKLILSIAICFMALSLKAQYVFEAKVGARLLGYNDTLHLANYTQITLKCAVVGVGPSWAHTKLFCNGTEVQPNCTPNEYDILFPGFYNVKLKHNGLLYFQFHFFVKP